MTRRSTPCSRIRSSAGVTSSSSPGVPVEGSAVPLAGLAHPSSSAPEATDEATDEATEVRNCRRSAGIAMALFADWSMTIIAVARGGCAIKLGPWQIHILHPRAVIPAIHRAPPLVEL